MSHSRNRALVLLGVSAITVAAITAYLRSQEPVEDPWATPSPVDDVADAGQVARPDVGAVGEDVGAANEDVPGASPAGSVSDGQAG